MKRTPLNTGDSDVDISRRTVVLNDGAAWPDKAPQIVTEVSRLDAEIRTFGFPPEVKIVKAVEADPLSVFLPSKLPVILPDGSRDKQEALLVAPDAYAFRLSSEILVEKLDAGELSPGIEWPSSIDDGRACRTPVAIRLSSKESL